MEFNILKTQKRLPFFFYFMVILANIIFIDSLPCAASRSPAIPHPILLKTQKCVAHSENTIETSKCHAEAYKEWDKELNDVYSQLMNDVTEKVTKKTLKDSQRAWLVFRDKSIEFLKKYYGGQSGTMWSIVCGAMQANIVKNRVMELNQILNSVDMSGDSSKNYIFEESCIPPLEE